MLKQLLWLSVSVISYSDIVLEAVSVLAGYVSHRHRNIEIYAGNLRQARTAVI